MSLRALILAALVVAAPAARADAPASGGIGLLDLAEAALAQHPTMRQAAAGRDAARHAVRDAYIGLGPRANMVFDTARERLDVFRSSTPVYRIGVSEFSNRGMTLEVVQPLFDARVFAQLAGAHATLRRAREELDGVRQRVLFEVVQAYLTALGSADGHAIASAEERTLRRQMQEVEQRGRLGLATPADADEVAARLRGAEAQTMAAAAALNEAIAGLERRTARRIAGIAPLGGRIPMPEPSPPTPETWVERARDRNAEVLVAQEAANEARAQALNAAAGTLPRVDLRFTQSHQVTGGSVYGGGSGIDDRTLLFRLTVPLFNGDGGGYPYFAARARHRASLYRVEDQRLEVEQQVRGAFEEVVSNARREPALLRAAEAQARVVVSKRQRLVGGVLRLKEVLDAERDQFQAERAVLSGRYNYLLNLMGLKRLAGDLSEADILYLDAMLDRRGRAIGRVEVAHATR
ncbi:TolC family protein [Belnapia sp. T6]|uniref:TolC family protein n=1 Tax=Belnapia mucosa TaxID=2804532 RepID=A0ABS1VA47_9PROT|nr:TolC family protein [Belnapia mucosa]MBL6458517.1 TolC family protein [Belnapia mucosa]